MICIAPTTLRDANAFVAKLHRHHKPVPGAKFSVSIVDESNQVRGVAIAGRPVSRMLDNGTTLEVNRCCTDGVRNGCSMLYRAVCRAAKAMGFSKVITYTLPEEGGASLRGAGFRFIGERGGGQWSRPSRARKDSSTPQVKWLWEATTITTPTHRTLSGIGSEITALQGKAQQAPSCRGQANSRLAGDQAGASGGASIAKAA